MTKICLSEQHLHECDRCDTYILTGGDEDHVTNTWRWYWRKYKGKEAEELYLCPDCQTGPFAKKWTFGNA